MGAQLKEALCAFVLFCPFLAVFFNTKYSRTNWRYLESYFILAQFRNIVDTKWNLQMWGLDMKHKQQSLGKAWKNQSTNEKVVPCEGFFFLSPPPPCLLLVCVSHRSEMEQQWSRRSSITLNFCLCQKNPTDNSHGGLVLEEIKFLVFSFCFCRDVSSARSRAPQ